MLSFLVVVLVIVMLSFVFLGFNIFFRKKSFPETEIGRNREMRKLGLTCPKHDVEKSGCGCSTGNCCADESA